MTKLVAFRKILRALLKLCEWNCCPLCVWRHWQLPEGWYCRSVTFKIRCGSPYLIVPVSLQNTASHLSTVLRLIAVHTLGVGVFVCGIASWSMWCSCDKRTVCRMQFPSASHRSERRNVVFGADRLNYRDECVT